MSPGCTNIPSLSLSVCSMMSQSVCCEGHGVLHDDALSSSGVFSTRVVASSPNLKRGEPHSWSSSPRHPPAGYHPTAVELYIWDEPCLDSVGQPSHFFSSTTGHSCGYYTLILLLAQHHCLDIENAKA